MSAKKTLLDRKSSGDSSEFDKSIISSANSINNKSLFIPNTIKKNKDLKRYLYFSNEELFTLHKMLTPIHNRKKFSLNYSTLNKERALSNLTINKNMFCFRSILKKKLFKINSDFNLSRNSNINVNISSNYQNYKNCQINQDSQKNKNSNLLLLTSLYNLPKINNNNNNNNYNSPNINKFLKSKKITETTGISLNNSRIKSSSIKVNESTPPSSYCESKVFNSSHLISIGSNTNINNISHISSSINEEKAKEKRDKIDKKDTKNIFNYMNNKFYCDVENRLLRKLRDVKFADSSMKDKIIYLRKAGIFWRGVMQYCIPIFNLEKNKLDKKILIEQKKIIQQKLFSKRSLIIRKKNVGNDGGGESFLEGGRNNLMGGSLSEDFRESRQINSRYENGFDNNTFRRNSSLPGFLYTSKYFTEMRKKNKTIPQRIFCERLGGNLCFDENQ